MQNCAMLPGRHVQRQKMRASRHLASAHSKHSQWAGSKLVLLSRYSWCYCLGTAGISVRVQLVLLYGDSWCFCTGTAGVTVQVQLVLLY